MGATAQVGTVSAHLLPSLHFVCTTLWLYRRELGRLGKDTGSLETAESKNSILGDVLAIPDTV